ncbi:MAG: biopolymer transporter ExbD [Candidatus Omnitrophota bacterium]|jgi:biopolymer transport protein ExbD
MNFKSRKQNLIAEINITPFTDVILVLLIIFMITTPLIVQSSLKVNLAAAKSGAPVKKMATSINITVNKTGVIYLEKEAVTIDELTEGIGKIYADDNNLSILVHADEAVQFKYLARALDVLNGMGIKNINVAVATKK